MIRSRFRFTKKDRNGILFLSFLICLVQLGIFYFPSSEKNILIEDSESLLIEAKILYQKQLAENSAKAKIIPFNPNFITDYKGYVLGMTNEEIDKLLKFRSQGKWINSAKEFQKVTGVSEEWLDSIGAYFKFPEWVTNPKPRSSFKNYNSETILSENEKMDLNKANEKDLQKVYGIGEKLSARIIKYRDKFDGGFVSTVELNEIYGLNEERIQNILKRFTVKKPRDVTKYDLNAASKEELVLIPYIDYEIAHQIIEERTLRGGFKSLDELTKVKDFPIQKIEIIKLYLSLD